MDWPHNFSSFYFPRGHPIYGGCPCCKLERILASLFSLLLCFFRFCFCFSLGLLWGGVRCPGLFLLSDWGAPWVLLLCAYPFSPALRLLMLRLLFLLICFPLWLILTRCPGANFPKCCRYWLWLFPNLAAFLIHVLNSMICNIPTAFGFSGRKCHRTMTIPQTRRSTTIAEPSTLSKIWTLTYLAAISEPQVRLGDRLSARRFMASKRVDEHSPFNPRLSGAMPSVVKEKGNMRSCKSQYLQVKKIHRSSLKQSQRWN